MLNQYKVLMRQLENSFLGFEVWFSHSRIKTHCSRINITEARKMNCVLCSFSERVACYVETLMRVTYRLIIPFSLNMFDFAYLVFNILYDKLVNPKVEFLLKKKKDKCGQILHSQYLCFRMRAGLKFISILDIKFVFTTSEKKNNVVRRSMGTALSSSYLCVL